MMNDQDMQRLYLEYRAHTEQAQQLQNYLEQTGQGIVDINGIIGALQEFTKLEPGSKIFAPIANGIFIDATLNQASTVRMNTGAGIVVEKTVLEAVALLEKQRKDLEELRDRANADYAAITMKLREIEASIETKGE